MKKLINVTGVTSFLVGVFQRGKLICLKSCPVYIFSFGQFKMCKFPRQHDCHGYPDWKYIILLEKDKDDFVMRLA